MNTLFAPPEILSAYAFAEDGSDPDLPGGTHLRIYAGLGASFPLAPFAVFKLASQEAEPRAVFISDRDDKPVQGFDLSQISMGEATLLLGDSDTRHTVRVELDDPENRVKSVMLLSQRHRRAVAVRNKPRWMFSAPVMHRLRARGSASQLRIRTRVITIDDIMGDSKQLAGILGLPVEGFHTWYAGLQNRFDGLARVKHAAPMRLNPMDRPDGPFDPVSASSEEGRVELMLQTSQLGGGLENLLARLVDDSDPPWMQIETQDMLAPDGKKQIADAPRLGTLQMAALDPGLARFFGFADMIEDFPDLDHGQGWDTLMVVGLFALDPADFERRGLDLKSLLIEPVTDSQNLLEILVNALENISGQPVRDEIDTLINNAREKGLVAAPFVAVVCPVPPWLPPSLPIPQIVGHRWQAATGGVPSDLYRASFAFPHAPLASITSLGAMLNGSWVSRHNMLHFDGHVPPERAMPRMFGHEQESGSRLRKNIKASPGFEPAGLLSDQDISASAGQILYRAQAADFFGRFGSPVEFTLEPPVRPAPPPPVLRFHIERAAIDLTSLNPLSPGAARLTVAVPQPWPTARFTANEENRLGSAIVVPRIDDLAAGSLNLTRLELSIAGQTPILMDLSAPGFFDVDLPLPMLNPQEQQTWTLTGVFKDAAGTASAPAALPVKVTDVRPPKVYPTGIGLFWTSSPGPSAEVELKLAWPAPAGSLHRVYLTDQQGLRLSEADIDEQVPGAGPSRGRVAAAGCNKVLAPGNQISRTAFRLLTEQSVQAGADGRVVLATRLPRSMETVQFLRIVPLGPDGAEPPFEQCGIVPIAVPDSRRPAAPRLEGQVVPETGAAQLRVVADGFDQVALERDEPGLFNAGAAGNEAPQFRIRRAVGKIADPIYARQIGSGPLALEGNEAVPPIFSAELTDDNAGRGLEPFVRYVYWAEVRLPPERRLPADLAPLDPPGGVTVVDPANAMSQPRPVSLPSAPRILMHIPPNAPAAPLPDAGQVTRGPADAAGNVTLTITIADPPHAHAKADPYRLAVWSQWPGQGIEPITNANGAALGGIWPDISNGVISVSINLPASVDPASMVTLRLAFVDPINRFSDLTTISVPA